MTIDMVMKDGSVKQVPVTCRVDTLDELNYYRHGGILPTCCASSQRDGPPILQDPDQDRGNEDVRQNSGNVDIR
jgi:hypothetical protein